MDNKLDEGISQVLQLGYSKLENVEDLDKLKLELLELDVNQQIERMRFLGMYNPDDPVLSNFERFKQYFSKNK